MWSLRCGILTPFLPPGKVCLKIPPPFCTILILTAILPSHSWPHQLLCTSFCSWSEWLPAVLVLSALQLGHVMLRITCLLLSPGDPPTDSCFLGYSSWSMLASQTSDWNIFCLTKDSKSFLSVWEQQEQGCSTGEYKLALSTATAATAHCNPMIPSWAEQHPRRLVTSQWPSDGWKVMSQVQDEPRISSQEVRKHVWALSNQ